MHVYRALAFIISHLAFLFLGFICRAVIFMTVISNYVWPIPLSIGNVASSQFMCELQIIVILSS